MVKFSLQAFKQSAIIFIVAGCTFGLITFLSNNYSIQTILYSPVLVAIICGAVISSFAFTACENKDETYTVLITIIILSVAFISFSDFFLPWWLFIILAFAIGEFAFWFDKKEPTVRQNRFWFTAERKSICIGISAVAVLIAMGIVNLIRLAIPWIGQYWEVIVTWLGYIGIVVVAVLFFGFIAWAYIKLNSLKYRDKKTAPRNIIWKKVGSRNLRYQTAHRQLHRKNKYHVHKVGYIEYKMEVNDV